MDEAEVDRKVERYLKKAYESPYVGPNWEWVDKAAHLLRLGPSMALRERVVEEYIKLGNYFSAESVARTYLWRQLTATEVRKVIDQYLKRWCGGGTRDDHFLGWVASRGGERLHDEVELKIAYLEDQGSLD